MLLELFLVILSVFNAAFMPGVISYCMFKATRYRMWEHTVTYLGKHKVTRKVYIPAMILASMTTMVNLLLALIVFGLWQSPWLKELAVIAGASFLLVPVTHFKLLFLNQQQRRFVHNIAATIFFLSMILFIILFHHSLLRMNGFFGRIGLAWGIVMLFVTAYSFYEYKITSIPEWVFMFFVSIWNLFLALMVVMI